MKQEKIGPFIAEIRKQLGMTQKELAEKLGISDKTVSKWECGNSIPDISYLEALCDSLDIKVNELLSGERLTDKSYSEKAEENIMALIKENKSNKKGSLLQLLFGIVLTLAAFLCMFFCGERRNLTTLWNYFDFVTLLVLILLCTAIVLLSKRRTWPDILDLLQKIILPCGIFDFLFQCIFVLNRMDSPVVLTANLSVCSLSLLYSAGAFLVFTILKERRKNSQ